MATAKPRKTPKKRVETSHNNVTDISSDPIALYFEEAAGHLVGLGMTDRSARSIAGMLAKRHGMDDAIRLIRRAAEIGPVMPVPWLQRASGGMMAENKARGDRASRVINAVSMRMFLDMGGDDIIRGAGIPYSKAGLIRDLPDFVSTHFPEFSGPLPDGWEQQVIGNVTGLFSTHMGISDPWADDADYDAWLAWNSDVAELEAA